MKLGCTFDCRKTQLSWASKTRDICGWTSQIFPSNSKKQIQSWTNRHHSLRFSSVQSNRNSLRKGWPMFWATRTCLKRICIFNFDESWQNAPSNDMFLQIILLPSHQRYMLILCFVVAPPLKFRTTLEGEILARLLSGQSLRIQDIWNEFSTSNLTCFRSVVISRVVSTCVKIWREFES